MSDCKVKEARPVTTRKRKGKWTTPVIYAALVVILALLPLVMKSNYMLHIMILVFTYLIATVSLRTITISGQFPLAHAAFMGLGAYCAAILGKLLGWPVWLTIPTAGVFTAIVSMLIGLPFARLRALYYAMASLFFGIGILQIIYSLQNITGGYSGLYGIPPMFASGNKEIYYYFFLALAVVCIFALYRFEFSRIGINMKAVAQSHLVASSVGINEAWYRILALGVGCFFVGLAGAAYAHYNLVLSTPTFGFMSTLWLVMYVLIGGIESFAGPIIGTFIFILVPEYFRDLKIYAPFVSAVILGIVYLMPKGLVGLPELIKTRFIERADKQKGSHAS
jgi:branched-chain amino acid transport system permease protein